MVLTSDPTCLVHNVDDDGEMRESIECVLNTVGFAVAKYPTAEDFLTHAASTIESRGVHHCLLVDLMMPGMSGLRLLREIQSRKAHCAFVVISGNGDVSSAVEAMQLGAVDFLEKPFTHGRLLEAVNEALRKARRRQERSESEEVAASRLAKLTDREQAVFHAMAEGLLTKEIAKRFAISTRTVDVHRSRIMHKLGLASPLQLAHFLAALKMGETNESMAQ